MKKYNVVIVDDEKDVANAMRDSLAILEIYAPTVALGGGEALDLASKTGFDAFLVDQIMPGMTGTEFVRKLLAIVADPLIYIITAEDDGIALAEAEKPREQGGIPVKRYVRKPWQQSLFTVDLREDLRERDLNRELHVTMESFSSRQKEIQMRLARAQNGIAAAEKKDAAMTAAFTVVKAANHEINNINMGSTGCTMRLENFLRDGKERLQTPEIELLAKLCDSQTRLSGRLKDYAGFVTALFTQTEELKRPARLSAVVAGGIEDLLAEKDCSAITIERDVTDELTVECYAQQLRYAIYQIIKNGVEAMPGGGRLSIMTAAQNDEVVITVRDWGGGIPKENLDMIFIPLFTRTKIYGGKGGCVAHRIVCENHQGKILVESATQGATKSDNDSQRPASTTVTIVIPR